MRSSVQPSSGSEGSFTGNGVAKHSGRAKKERPAKVTQLRVSPAKTSDGALSLLRSSVTTAPSKDLKKSPKIAGKAFQTAHDSSGWDRKARWQRAFNLARDKMGIQGMDESVDKWGAGLRESEGGDRRSTSAQPVRRGSVVSVGPLAGGAPGTIAELRTPVALKEHLKRGKGARETGIQLVTLEGSGLEAPLSERDAAAVVAQFDQRRQMLGAPASPSRPALTPADRALKAWTNANNTGNNNSAPVIINAACSGSTSCGSTHSNASSSAGGGSSAGGSSSAGGGAPTGSCAQLPASPAVAGSSGGESTAGEAATPAGTAVARVLAVASGSSAGVAVGGSGNSFSGGGSSAGAGGLKLQRRLSENGSAGTGCSDGPFLAMRRNAVVMAPDSIIARSPQHLQCHGPGSGSGSLHRLSLDSPAPAQSLERQPAGGGGEAAAAAAPSPATRGSLSRQNSAAFLVAAAGSVAAVHSGEHAGAWVPLGGPCDASGGGGGSGGGGSLRPTPRPASAGLRATHSPTWAPPAAAAGTESQPPPPPPPSAGGEHSGLSPFASAHVSATALAQAQRQPSLTLALPALQVPSPSAEHSCSPPRLSAGWAVPSSCSPSTALPATASCGGGIGVEPDARRLASPSSDGAGATPASLGLHLAATSPIGAAAGWGLLPVPPPSSLDATPGLTGGPRRPRPRASATGDGAIAGSAAAAAAGLAASHSSGATSQPLPLLQHTGWISVDASPGAIDGAASAAAAAPSAPPPPPPPSRLVMHTSPASSSSSHSPSRPGGAPPGYRRMTTSSSGHSALTGPPPPPPASPPMALRPHAPAQPPAPTSPSPPSPSLAGAAYRRSSMPATTAMLAIANGARVAVVGSPSPAQPSPLRQTAFKATGGGGGVIVGAVTAARGRLTDDGSIPAAGSGLRAGSVTARAAGSGGGAAAAAARTTPVSDAVLAGLRVVATEVADELSREAEVAAATRQALAQRTRMRVSDSGGKSRHVSMPGDPWRKWG